MKTQIVKTLLLREHGVKDFIRWNQSIMRQLVLSENTTYSLTGEEMSKSDIFYDASSKKIFLDKNRTCIQICGYGSPHRLLYKLAAVPKSGRIEDTVTTTINFPQENFQYLKIQVRLILTADNWLHVINIENGKGVQSVYLSETYTFRQLSMETEGFTIVLKSTRDFKKQKEVLCALMFFKLYPFEYIGTIEISKKIFGYKIQDVEAMDGFLIICENTGVTSFYSLNSILDQIKYTDSIQRVIITPGNGAQQRIVDKFPMGLPVNIFLTELPALLFQATSERNSISIEGHPFQYIIETVKNKGSFKVFTICPPHEIKNNSMRYPQNHMDDAASFHPDNSGRILHHSCYEFRMLKVVVDQLQHLSTLWRAEEKVKTKMVQRTASGRQIRAPNWVESAEGFKHKFCCFNFENEVDVLSILTAHKISDEVVTGTVNLHDNAKGELIKKLHFQENWEEDDEHTITLDMDILVHIVKTLRYSVCYIYHLSRTAPT